MRKIIYTLLLSIFATFANAETIFTFGKQMGDEIYEGFQVGAVQPLTEFDASASLTDMKNGSLITLGAQKGMEIYSATMLYGFMDLNKFFWDNKIKDEPKTQLGYGFGVSLAFLDPVILDLRYKKFEEHSNSYTYVGIAYMF